MVQRTGEQGQGNVLFVQNNFYYDAFFLKTIGESTNNCLRISADGQHSPERRMRIGHMYSS